MSAETRLLMVVCVPLAALVAGCSVQANYAAQSHLNAQRPMLSDDLETAFNRAVALVAELRYAEAAAGLSPLVERFEAASNAIRAAEATFWLGYCREKQGQAAEARTLYGRIVDRYSDSPACRNAAARLSRMR